MLVKEETIQVYCEGCEKSGPHLWDYFLPIDTYLGSWLIDLWRGHVLTVVTL